MWVIAILFIPAVFMLMLALEAIEKPLGPAIPLDEPKLKNVPQIPQQRNPNVPINN